MFKHIAGSFDLDIQEALKELRKHDYREKIIQENLKYVKFQISLSTTPDILIIQSINAIEDLDRTINLLSKRYREWYGYFLPELSEKIQDHEIFIRRSLEDKNELIKELNIDISMGKDFDQKHIDAMNLFARHIIELFDQRADLKEYLELIMQEQCPNLFAVAGSLIGAKLIEKAGSLKHLSIMPSSTIQLLGAEKALFRHLRNKKIRPPKHGLILSHPYVMDAKNKGKAARVFSAKISIATKVDYFKGEFIGDRLKEELN